MPLEKVQMVLKIAKEPISLETPIGEDEDSHLGDFIEDKKRPSITDEVIQRNLAAHTRKVLSTLTPREEKVLKMRFGIGERSNHTLEEVGQDFAVTRERIRQIEAKALRKLRHPSPRARAASLRGLSGPRVERRARRGAAVPSSRCQLARGLAARPASSLAAARCAPSALAASLGRPSLGPAHFGAADGASCSGVGERFGAGEQGPRRLMWALAARASAWVCDSR